MDDAFLGSVINVRIELIPVTVGNVMSVDVKKLDGFTTGPLHAALEKSVGRCMFGPGDKDTLRHQDGQTSTTS